MNTIPVYRNQTWIEYTVPEDVRHIWSHKLKLQAASVFATARCQGHSPSQSASLAEMVVNKSLYNGLHYDKKMEATLQSLLV